MIINGLFGEKFLSGSIIKKYLPILEGKIEVPEVNENGNMRKTGKLIILMTLIKIKCMT